MADADFGYVAAHRESESLRRQNTVKFNIPEAEAWTVCRDLIREHGKWIEPVLSPTMAGSNR